MLLKFKKSKTDWKSIEKIIYMLVINSPDRVGPSFKTTLTSFDACIGKCSEKILPEILEGKNGLKEITVEPDEKV